MTEYKHAAVLRAIADGVPLDDFEITWGTKYQWVSLLRHAHRLFSNDNVEVRRKPQHIIVNGFKVPKPLEVEPGSRAPYFVACPTGVDLYVEYDWQGYTTDLRLLKRGLCHTTKEAAIAHTQAMLGIDPQFLDPEAA